MGYVFILYQSHTTYGVSQLSKALPLEKWGLPIQVTITLNPGLHHTGPAYPYPDNFKASG